jgi:hypothetical protein
MFLKRTVPDAPSTDKKLGGIAFLLSLLFLTLLAAINLEQLPNIWNEQSAQRLGYLLMGLIPGVAFALFILRGKYSVLLHEFKHSIVSGLAGNKWKSMKIDDASGSFTYAYSKRSAAFNAFISLAPYWFPLGLIISLIVGAMFWRQDPFGLLFVLGIGIGIDLVLNIRDISPYQTDFKVIRGGFTTGFWYVVAMNVVLYTFVLAWAFAGTQGLLMLVSELWRLVHALVEYFRAKKSLA